MIEASHYTYRVRWSAADGEFVASVAELPSLSWLDEDQVEALSPTSGRGWATLVADGTIEGRIFFHMGDDSSFRAIPMDS